MNLARFNILLKACPEDELNTFVQKNLLHGVPFVFKDREDDFFEFRNRIATRFGISFHEVFILGSAKMGFSYWQHRDSFDYDSDIDVAIISGKLYEDFSKLIVDFAYNKANGLVTLSAHQEKVYARFLRYFAKGWIRPDLATAIMVGYPLIDDWDDFFRSISYGKSEVGNYEVDAGVFKSYDYLQRYHFEGLKKHQRVLKARS